MLALPYSLLDIRQQLCVKNQFVFAHFDSPPIIFKMRHVGGKSDNRFQQIVFQNVATNFAFARARSAGEEWGAVEDDAKVAAAVFGGTHLRYEMHEEQKRTVADSGQTGTEATVETLLIVLPAYVFRTTTQNLILFYVRRLYSKYGYEYTSVDPPICTNHDLGF